MANRELIVEIYNGLLDGVYSIDPEPVSIEFVENDEDLYDERTESYWRNRLLAEWGCVNNLYCDKQRDPLTDREKEELFDEMFDSLPRTKENDKKAVYISGYLSLWAELNRYIAALYRGTEDEKEKGRSLFAMLKPFLDSTLSAYDTLFHSLAAADAEAVNENDEQDGSGELKEKKGDE